ncbi:hypothetical protein [Thermus amyloliquefaciens]|uniref:hypothetical protein n=1 Tax=Thermus amyloliquefaciens TaxID=1449080 RepID=UPI00056F34F0|nr:hypothetical protein [Thermus amyloliquefaciens]
MRKGLLGVMFLLAGLSLAQGVDYRQAAVASAALARLQAVAQTATGEEKFLTWAKEVKARAEKSYEAKAYFKAAREAQAALLLFRAAQGELQVRAKVPAAPRMGMGLHHGWGHGRWDRGAMGQPPRAVAPQARLAQGAQAAVDRAEKELAYYRAQDSLVKDLVAEAKNRLSKEPDRAFLLARAALALISAERGF